MEMEVYRTFVLQRRFTMRAYFLVLQSIIIRMFKFETSY